jgi:alkanesulfonate monooxygenase SsuD/methylene tetrahydromethanopterin reductase-like flavin-dependent oxidoreductase (luciferase family)
VRFNLFMYCTVGRRAELEAGSAGLRNDLYQRMLDEIAEYVRFADQAGYDGFGHPEHHLQVEGFEISNDPNLMSMWLGRHSERLRVITCGFVSTTHNPLRTAESIATLDHMHKGRFGFGLVRGYQHRWVGNFKIRDDLDAIGPWNKDTPVDDLNREYFAEFVDIVMTALREPLIDYQGKFWQFPPRDFRNPHRHDVYTDYGEGVTADMAITHVGIAPRPYQQPHPPVYGGFSSSMRTAVFWAQHRGKPIVMSSNHEFCRTLWDRYHEAAAEHGHDVPRGDEAAWGGLMVCAPTDEQAQEWFADMEWFWNAWSVPFGNPMPELLVGSPDTISARIEEARRVFDPRETFLLIPQGLHERDQVLTSLELFATKVMPRFSEVPT